MSLWKMGPIRIFVKNPVRPIINALTMRDNPATREMGATGTVIFGGLISTEEEYNPDLQGEKGLETYDKMRRSDGQVRSALLACELPFRAPSTVWDIEAASDSVQDKEIADFVRDNLFNGMTITWDDFLHHVLMMYWAGYSVFEKVWELRDGRWAWRKFAPRLPKTIVEWHVDDTGGLEWVKQRAWKGERYEDIDIPIEKLLVFTLDREGSNYTGMSLLRAAYKHWYFKNNLCIIDGLAAERHGMGLAKFKYPKNATPQDKNAVKSMGEKLHAHERSYIALPDDMDLSLMGVTGQLHNIKASIEYHDMQIARSILAQFINLGGSDVGSYALSQDQSGFFLMSLQAIGRYVCDTFNRHAIKQLVDYNWNVSKYPRLTVSGLEHFDIEKLSKSIVELITAGVIESDKNIEAVMRQRLHLPALTAPKMSETVKMKELSPWRQVHGHEKHMAFSDISKTMDNAVDAFVDATKGVQDRQIKALADQVSAELLKNNLDKVVQIDVPYRAQMAEAVEDVLVAMFNYGREQVRKELAKQKGGLRAAELAEEPLESIEDIKSFIKTKSKAVAGILGSKLRSAMAWQALTQFKAGSVDKLMLVGVMQALSDKELKNTAHLTVSEAFNLGRDMQARQQADEIDRVVYSALLDDNVCPKCKAKDGTEYAFPSAAWDEVKPPYRECEGQDKCRCLGVYIYKSERK